MRALAIVAAFTAVGCSPTDVDYGSVCAFGTVDLDPLLGADTSSFAYLQVWLGRREAGATPLELEPHPRVGAAQMSRALPEIQWPFEYMIGCGVGIDYDEHWRVLAFLAAEGQTQPSVSGTLYGYNDFDALEGECDGRPCYHGPGTPIDIVLNAVAP
jgi:hypothetical protein